MTTDGITMKTTSACSAHVLLMFWACSFLGNSMNNLLSYCGLVDGRISSSEKDLPVSNLTLVENNKDIIKKQESDFSEIS